MHASLEEETHGDKHGETSSSCDALPGDSSKPESRQQAEEEGALLMTTLAVHSGLFLLWGIKPEAVTVSISC